MQRIMEVIALFLGFGGWILSYVSLEDHYWKESTQDGSVILTSTVYENLWMSCASDSTGVYNCRDFPSLFALPAPRCKVYWELVCGPVANSSLGNWTFRQARKKEDDKMNPVVEAFACFLGFLGWIMVGVALPNRYWRESTVDGNVITTSTIYENLWMSCATDATGVHNCRDFPSLLALNGYIQASRALMIVSIVFGTFGLAATLMGMQCTKVCGENYILKGRIAAIGGVFFLLQGLCTMIAVSWYAANITQQFFDQLYAGTKYEIGEGLYIGWSSAILAMCGGSCLLCSCKLNSSNEKNSYPYHPPSRGHVLSTVPSLSAPSNYDRNAYV